MEPVETYGTDPETVEKGTNIQYWNTDDLEAAGCRDDAVCGFVHPPTATAAVIYDQTGGYTVQVTQGDFADGDCVRQTDNPVTHVSGSVTVLLHEVETLEEARATARLWMRGWSARSASVVRDEGGVADARLIVGPEATTGRADRLDGADGDD